jgi:hypothetical protein
MKSVYTMAFAVAVLAGSTTLAEDLKSGLQAGQKIGAFDVVKKSGADNDGVKVDAQLCYRCRYGARPQVMIFTRSTGENVASLSKQIDELVAKNTEKKLASFVNVLGENRDKAEAAAKELGTANKLTNVPVVVPVEFENGPADYGVNAKADVTVIFAVGGSVKSNLSFAKDGLDKDAVKKVVAEVSKILE